MVGSEHPRYGRKGIIMEIKIKRVKNGKLIAKRKGF